MHEPRLTWPIALLYYGVRVAGWLPLRMLHAAGALFGHVLWWFNANARRICQINLALVLPQTSETERRRIARASLVEAGKSLTEIARIWSRRPDDALALVREENGVDRLDAALKSGRGVIICAPHLGCWELLNFWLAARMPLAIVYRPPRRTSLEPLLRRARGGVPVEQIRAEGAGVRTLYRRLAAGGAVVILPDQQPKRGEGQFAPFFGVDALTMVLVSRLAQRTGACVVFAFAERLPRGGGFHIHVSDAPTAIGDPDLGVACTALNQGIECCVVRAFTQYQWHYKRFSKRPSGGETSPYRKA